MTRPVLSRDAVKIIAMITMMIDHAAVFFAASDGQVHAIMRAIGRVSYPLFVMLFTEGCIRAKSPVWKRLLYLCIAGAAAEPFYDMMVSRLWLNSEAQNVMWSWVLALLFCAVMKKLDEARSGTGAAMYVVFSVGICFIFIYACVILCVDYSFLHAICVMFCWFWMHGDLNPRKIHIGGICAAVFLALSTPACVLAIPVICLYDPDKSGTIRVPKWAGYGFYPVHLMAYTGIYLAMGL